MLALTGCGDFKPPVGPDDPGGNNPVQPGGPDDPTPGEDDPTLDEDTFTVVLLYRDGRNWKRFIPDPDEQIVAIWTDLEGNGVYPGVLGKEGVASRTDLDGDYKVTLQTVPDGFAYDPNVYEATNYNKHVEISLFSLTKDYGSASNAASGNTQRMPQPYDNNYAFELPGTGTFRFQLESSTQSSFFYFRPNRTGVFSIQSIADITENKVNPILDIYQGTFAFISPGGPAYTLDGGGKAENTYTKNFNWTTQITSVGQGFFFAIRSTSIDESAYPMQVDFILEFDSEITGSDEIPFRVINPTEEFVQQPDAYSTFKYVASLNAGRLDSSLFRLWSKDELGKNEDGDVIAGDGYYHFYLEEPESATHPETGEPITVYVYSNRPIYARISQDSQVIDTLDDGATGPGAGFTDPRVPKRLLNGVNDSDPCDYSQLIAAYAQYCDNNGAYPLTEELRGFFMKYSVSQLLFNDGNGIAEGAGYASSYSNQWLFNCGYYEAPYWIS